VAIATPLASSGGLVTNLFLRRSAVLAAATLAAVGIVSVAPANAAPPITPALTHVRLITLNDFHGNLQPPTGSSGRVTLAGGATVDAGGAAFVATHVKQLRAAVQNSVMLSAGDNIGASPLESALFHDEPTIEFLNEIGLSASAVGNHELDEGYQELLRMQSGGCHPTDGCQFRPTYDGADFPFLGSNIYFEDGTPAVLAFTVKQSGGVPIGVIGATLEDLPSVVTPEAIEGLKFGDEVEAINRTSAILDGLGIRSQVVVLHQGDSVTGTGGPNACNLLPGGLGSQIAAGVSSSVDAIFTGHSHQAYNCMLPDPSGRLRPVMQAASFGRLLAVVDLTINTQTKDVIRPATVARNEIVTRDVTPDPQVAALVSEAVAKSAPIGDRPIGSITADITRSQAPSGEQPLGDVIADGQLAATQAAGAQVAITNPGGIRADLTFASSAGEGDGVVTYREAFQVQPFSNIMQTITLTGAQLDAVLEQQWSPSRTFFLQISATLHYTQRPTNPMGDRVSDITIGGQPVSPTGTYRVSVNNFLAAGGDGFTVFADGTDLAGGPIDLDAFTAYLSAHPGLAPPPASRVTVIP
jgi:5'-nucleotidase